jgi:hypothetical protein
VFICVICGQLRAALCPLCLCGFSVNENALLWTFWPLFGYC